MTKTISGETFNDKKKLRKRLMTKKTKQGKRLLTKTNEKRIEIKISGFFFI